MCAFEQKMHEAPSLKRVHTDLVFLHDHWFRELMVSLHEVGFKEVPDFVYGAVHDFAKSWHGTKITEDAHKVLRDKNRHSKSNAMCPKERWHKCVASPLLQDCDRQEVSITGAAKHIATKKVPKGTFEWVGTEKFSLGLDVLRTLGDSNPSWPTMSPATYREMPMAWKSVTSAAPEFAEVSNTWVALLLEPGQLVKIGDKYCGLVVAVTEWGFLCMKMSPTKTRGIGHVHLVLDGQKAIVEHMSFTDISSVKVLNIMPASPARWSSDVQQASRCIVMRSDGGPSSLLKPVARNAFKNLTVPRLEMLASLLKVKFEANERRPRTLHDWLEYLVKFALPGIEPGELKRIVAARAKPSKHERDLDNRCQLLKASNLEVARNDLLGTEVDEVAKSLEEKRARKRAQEEKPATVARKASSSGSGAAASSSSSAPAPAGSRPVMTPGESRSVWTAKDTQAFAPPGASVSKQATPHVRWQGHYKNKPSPNYTKSYSAFSGMSEEGALLCVLMQLWRWH